MKQNRKTRRAEKFRGYSPVRAAGGEAEHTKVGVEKGFGPRHAANAKEGELVDGRGKMGDGTDLTKVNTDSVPAMLTPREAVLNRNAAELAGRPNIEALNAQGNKLAEKGVDLAAGGETSVRKEVMKSKPKQSEKAVPAYGKLPAPPQAQPAGQRGGFYPPGMSKFAEGSPEIPGIGAPNPQRAYDPAAQVDFKAPDLSGFIRALHEEGKKQGLSESQMAGIAKQFGGLGGGGAPAGGDMPYDQLGGQYASFTGGTPGYQGGISEIGYPPMLMPGAEYHGDKGSTWTGPYDPQFLVERYAGGTGDVPGLQRGERDFRGGGGRGFGASTMAWGGDRPSWNPNAFPPDLPPEGPSMTPNLDRPFQGNNDGYIIRSSWQGGQPGMPWSPTAIPTTYDPQGYPYGVPVLSPDTASAGPHPHTPPRYRS